MKFLLRSLIKQIHIGTYEVIENKKDSYYDFINIFMDIFESKFKQLSELGIQKEDVSVCQIYSYDGKCNMEYDQIRLKRVIRQ